MPFRNIQIDPANLPKIEDLRYTPLHKSYRSVSVMGTLLFWLFLAALLFTFNASKGEDVMDVIGSSFDTIKLWGSLLLCVVFLFSMYVAFAGFSKKGYAVREKDIVYKRGLFWKSITNIPFNRVQHAEVKQGPIERLFSISQLNIFTAGGSASDLRIPGLTLEEAESLKRYVVQKVSKDEEE